MSPDDREPDTAHDPHATDAGGSRDDVPQGNEPGASSTPSDEGRGTVELGDRLGGDSPAANQAKTEPIPPSPPELGDMNAGRAGAHTPSPAQLDQAAFVATPASAGPGDGQGVPVLSDRAADGTSQEQAPVQGVVRPTP